MLELPKPFTEGRNEDNIPRPAKNGGGDSHAEASPLNETDAEETLMQKLNSSDRIHLRWD